LNIADIMPAMLLMLFSLALSIGTMTVLFIIHHVRQRRLAAPASASYEPVMFTVPVLSHASVRRPPSWLAIKSRNLRTVQSALGLHNPKPCSFLEGLAGEGKLFIAPPIQGWILVLGEGLPQPDDDVDICYRFLINISRRLGEVQFYSANRITSNHAWVRLNRGRVVRAYAWAGKTLWHQGRKTASEEALSLRCLDYTEAAERSSLSEPDWIISNVEKVPLLAARWSLDPACIDERLLETELGIAGKPSRRY